MGRTAQKKACMRRMQQAELSDPGRFTFILRIDWASESYGVAPPLWINWSCLLMRWRSSTSESVKRKALPRQPVSSELGVIIAHWRLVRCVRMLRSTVNSSAKKMASMERSSPRTFPWRIISRFFGSRVCKALQVPYVPANSSNTTSDVVDIGINSLILFRDSF
jgi:hypothetical protein